MLLLVFHRRLRLCAAILWLAGAGLAAMSAVLAFGPLGAGQSLAFAVVAVLLAGAVVSSPDRVDHGAPGRLVGSR